MMSETWGEIVDNVCVNIVIASAQWIAEQPGYWILSTPENMAWIGATVTDGIFEPFPTLNLDEFVPPVVEVDDEV